MDLFFVDGNGAVNVIWAREYRRLTGAGRDPAAIGYCLSSGRSAGIFAALTADENGFRNVVWMDTD